MVQTEAQYKFVYMAVQQHIETVHYRVMAEQASTREYTNIKYSSELAPFSDPAHLPELTGLPGSVPTSPTSTTMLMQNNLDYGGRGNKKKSAGSISNCSNSGLPR